MDTSIPQKQCNKCLKEFPATKEYFVTDKKSHGGLRPLCKECRRMTRKDFVNPPVPRGMKRCSTCREIFPATDVYFSLRKRAIDGLYEVCRTCRKTSYKANKEAFNTIQRPATFTCKGCDQVLPFTEQFFYRNARTTYGLFTKCRPCIDKQNEAYRSSHREEATKRARAWRHKNRDHCINVAAKWRDANIDRVRANRRRRYAANPEQMRQNKFRYNHSEHGKFQNRCYNRSRKARRKGIGGHYTAQDIQHQYARQKGKCYWCHKKITKYHIDHVIPVTREGSSNDPWNLVIACPTCNMKRNNKLPHEWPQGGHLM